jgi:hypothetical protein
MIEVRRERESFFAPVTEPKERADADPPEARFVSPLGTGEPPIVIFFRPAVCSSA